MNWSLFRWIWRLESPLYVGAPPAGALNRCRLFVPVRPLWGAVTAELARRTSSDAMPDYEHIGKEIKESYRFTCLFPAEKRGDNYVSWKPEFVRNSGLQWYCDNGNSITNREFRRLLISARSGTAVSPETFSASDGSLRETECLGHCWRNTGNSGELSAVYMLGYVFLSSNTSKEFCIESISTLFIGGDTRYGLGRMSLVDFSEATTVFEKQLVFDDESPIVKSNTIFGYAIDSEHDICMKDMIGNKELLFGWDYGKQRSYGHAWVPGSSLPNKQSCWMIDQNGYWLPTSDKTCLPV